MSKLWSLPVISVYLYAATILTQYGFNSYFNIPSSFIEASIKENIVYFFQLFQVASAIAGVMRWWMWVIVIIAALVITFFYNFHSFFRGIISLAGTIILGLLLWGSYNFGSTLAANTTTFHTLPVDCLQADENITYIIPNIYEGKAILIPIEKDTNKMTSSFLVKETSELGCAIEQKEIGKIVK